MPSIRALYNDELVQAHREAVAALRELLAAEKNPLERRKLANAILRARTAKDDIPPSPAPSERRCHKALRVTDEGALPAATHSRTNAVQADDHDKDDFESPNDPAVREIDELAHQLQHGPNPLAALARLKAIMKGSMAALTSNANGTEST